MGLVYVVVGNRTAKPLRDGDQRELVGAAGFEPAAFCTQSRRATKLRHAPSRAHCTGPALSALRQGSAQPKKAKRLKRPST